MLAASEKKKTPGPACVQHESTKKRIKLYIGGSSSIYGHSNRDEEILTAVIFLFLLRCISKGAMRNSPPQSHIYAVTINHIHLFIGQWNAKHTHTPTLV